MLLPVYVLFTLLVPASRWQTNLLVIPRLLDDLTQFLWFQPLDHTYGYRLERFSHESSPFSS